MKINSLTENRLQKIIESAVILITFKRKSLVWTHFVIQSVSKLWLLPYIISVVYKYLIEYILGVIVGQTKIFKATLWVLANSNDQYSGIL